MNWHLFDLEKINNQSYLLSKTMSKAFFSFIKWEQPPEFRLDIQSERCVKSECQDYYQGMLPEGEV